MNTEEILARLAACDDDGDLVKADGFDDAIIGVAEGWFAGSQCAVVCYDYQKCVAILAAQGMSEGEAEEYLDHNTLGAYVGDHTPIFLHDWRKEGE